MTLNLRLVLRLPRDPTSARVARHLCVSALSEVGAGAGVIGDIALAVTEACANVTKHAGVEADFEVRLELDSHGCIITVIDRGEGFEMDLLEGLVESTCSERGRGVALMRSVMDSVRFSSSPGMGTAVRLERRWPDPATDSPAGDGQVGPGSGGGRPLAASLLLSGAGSVPVN